MQSGVEGESWNQFRGPNGDGKSDAQNLLIEFSENKNVQWKTPIHNQGWPSPVLWRKQIWLTTAREDGTELFAICVDLESGKVVHYIKMFHVVEPQLEYLGLNAHTSPTPVIEEERVYIHYSNTYIITETKHQD